METVKPSAVVEDRMKALFWTISIMIGVLFGLGGAVNYLAELFLT
jgi:hypothetical protein